MGGTSKSSSRFHLLDGPAFELVPNSLIIRRIGSDILGGQDPKIKLFKGKKGGKPPF
jgi:hypothetical protein